jgi:hypothetical protein
MQLRLDVLVRQGQRGPVMTLDDFLADLRARAATAREAGGVARAQMLEDAATELAAAYQAHRDAEGRKVELFLRAEETDKRLGRIVLEPHETAAELGAAAAWVAAERLNAALARCQELLGG